jgi:hypothetical protein
VPSRDPREQTWVQNVLADSRVRLKLGDRIYERRAARVTDEAVIDAIVPAVLAKYGLEQPQGNDVPGVWFFRMDPR